MRVSKSAALLIAVVLLFVMFTMLYIRAENIADIPTEAFIIWTVTLIAGYIGLGVVNNGVKGRFWNNDMYDHENGGGGNMPFKNEDTGGKANGNTN
jgi:hypothetical protein